LIQNPKTIWLKVNKCRALSSPPPPKRLCGIRAYKTSARPRWGLCFTAACIRCPSTAPCRVRPRLTLQAAELRHLPMEPRTVLRIALAIGCRTLAESVGGICHVARETSIEAKASEQSPTSVGGRRFVVLAGERCIQRAGSEYADAKLSREPRNHSRRGGNL
jgi:hypothetical protein